MGKYTEEDKKTALEMVIVGGLAVAEVARRTGINARTIKRWRKLAQPDRVVEGRNPNGTYKPGFSGNPGGRSSANAAAEKKAALMAGEVLDTWIRRFREIANGEPTTYSDDLLIRYGEKILDRGLGKPKIRTELSGPDGEEIQIGSVAELVVSHYGVADKGPDLSDYLDVEIEDAELVEAGG